jgi:hypothetical protein
VGGPSPPHPLIPSSPNSGTGNLREALTEELVGDDLPPCFVYDEDPMYTKRESELIQQFLAEHGRMPSSGDDDLDDLF